MNEPHSLGGDRRLIDILVDHGCDAIPDEAIRELSARRVDSVRPGFALETGLLLLGSRTRDGASSLLALLRMPIGERLFRAVWLGPFGRWFVRRAARGLTPAKIASTGNTGAAVVTPKPTTARVENGTTFQDLDKRVRALEQWRRSHRDG